MKSLITIAALSIVTVAGLTGCTASVRPGVGAMTADISDDADGDSVAGDLPAAAAPAPLVEGPGVFAINIEPAPIERVYLYEPGYPPGCYLYGEFIYFGGFRYEHDIFVNRVVTENISRNIHMDVTVNRRVGERLERRHEREFRKYHGQRPSPRSVSRSGAGHEHADTSKRHHAEAKANGTHQNAANNSASRPPRGGDSESTASNAASAERSRSASSTPPAHATTPAASTARQSAPSPSTGGGMKTAMKSK